MGKLDCERANAAYWLEQEIDRRSEIIGLARERDRLRAWKINAQITLDYDKVQLDALADVIEATKAATKRGNLMTPPWVLDALNGTTK